MPNYFAGLPDVIMVGPYEVYITVSPAVDKKQSLGVYQSMTHGGKITLKKNHRTPSEAMDTVLHEIMHSIWDLAKIDSGFEEDVVQTVSTWYASVFTANPRLLQWMIKCICGK